MKRSMKHLLCSAATVFFSTAAVQAQLTWDVVPGIAGPGDGAITHSNGVWDTTTANWTADGGINNVTWTFGGDAVFGNHPSNTAVTVDIPDAGVTVGNLTLESNGTAKVSFQAITDNLGTITIASGGATWDTGGREIEIVGLNTANDTRLSVSSNDTLAVIGGGTFDAGEKQQNANWTADGATLDIQDAMIVRGNANNVGQFSTIKLADGATYIHERNSNQTYGKPDWDLGTGTVTFQNRWPNNGNITLNGVISGSGTMVIDCGGSRYVRINNTNTTFTGKYIVGSENNSGSELLNYAGDLAFGPVPSNAVPDYFTLKNSGELKLQNLEIHANRGITLDGIGIIINNGGPTVYGGTITGDGQLQVGRNAGADSNRLYLYSDTHDYTGGTRIWQGSIELGIDDALPNDGLLTIGGGTKNARLFMNGFDQTVGGLAVNGGNVREIVNSNTNGLSSTLTINVAGGQTYDYAGNFSGTNDFILVKEGAGVQRLSRGSTFGNSPVSLTINGGELEMSSEFEGLVTVNAGGTLGGIGTCVSNVVIKSGGAIAPGNNDGWNSLKFGETLDLSDMIDDNAGGIQIGFGAAKDSIIATNLASSGTINIDGAAGIFDLGFADFTFTHDPAYELASGTYPLLIADTIIGNLDPSDLSGNVGSYGATGTLSLSNNTVYLIVEGADTSAYGIWAAQYGVAEDGPEGDSDADGYNNFQEFAYGGNPTNAGDIGYAPAAGLFDDGSTNWLTLVSGYRSDTNSGVTYDYLTSGSLTIPAWTNAGITVLGTGTLDADFEVITNAIPIDDTQDFLGVFLEKTE